MLRAYDAYDFPTVFQTLNTLATVDLSAFYVDVTKDRMYTLGATSHERRSTQTAMYLICDGLARLLAPILPVTADDLWRHLPGVAIRRRCTSRSSRTSTRYVDATLVATWERLLTVREEVNAALEQKRKDKVIGNSLGARVIVTASGPVARLLERHRAQLPMLFIVSDVALHVGSGRGRRRRAGRGREGAWREVRALLALRARRPDGAGLGGHLRPLRGRALRLKPAAAERRAGQPLTCPRRAIRALDRGGHRRARSGGEGAGPRPARAARERRRSSRASST